MLVPRGPGGARGLARRQPPWAGVLAAPCTPEPGTPQSVGAHEELSSTRTGSLGRALPQAGRVALPDPTQVEAVAHSTRCPPVPSARPGGALAPRSTAWLSLVEILLVGLQRSADTPKGSGCLWKRNFQCVNCAGSLCASLAEPQAVQGSAQPGCSVLDLSASRGELELGLLAVGLELPTGSCRSGDWWPQAA